ncbi:MAG: hypothetical protein HYU52_13960 [Acidobacteria bacterium]|nr:hypothetical protein [Acidobacteriota bacterium]
MSNSFVKLVEDVAREELASLGYDYKIVVAGIDEQRDGEGCIIRMTGEVDDVRIIPTDDNPTRAGIAVQVRRKLEIALRGIDPFKTQAF